MHSKTLVLTVLALVAAFSLSGPAFSWPFKVGPDPKETDWESWGYTVDHQTWANFFRVHIPWKDTLSNMTGKYVVEEDFLIYVDPSTSGLSNPSAVYGGDSWNHDGLYGLGEFFDAGSQSKDQCYVLNLTHNPDDSFTWEVWYDGNTNQVRDADYEITILAGTCTEYRDVGGYFWGVLPDEDGLYNGVFIKGTAKDEGTPPLVDPIFVAGPCVPEPASVVLLGGAVLALVARKRRRAA